VLLALSVVRSVALSVVRSVALSVVRIYTSALFDSWLGQYRLAY